jgi:glycosyltransferase involved in cell wall biosynthesis
MRAQVVYVLSQDPLVVTGSFASYVAMAEVKRPFTFLYHNPGWLRFRSLPRYIKIIRHFGGNAKLHFITNEESEKRWLQLIGQKATCLGHNLHVREHFFVPGEIPKKYDAVYAATMAPYKRIELAREIQKLCFVTYVTHQKNWNLHEFEPRLRHADYNSEFISREAVRLCYQQSQVGLALSAAEGAMFSCTEYLLCGLPVVTTPNRGGRNRYLDDENSTFVPPDAGAVRKAVESYVTNPPDPATVRNSAMRKMHGDRLKFIEILASYGGTTHTNPNDEVERIWGTEQGIEKIAISKEDIKNKLD